jgi:hypothetical protein
MVSKIAQRSYTILYYPVGTAKTSPQTIKVSLMMMSLQISARTKLFVAGGTNLIGHG